MPPGSSDAADTIRRVKEYRLGYEIPHRQGSMETSIPRFIAFVRTPANSSLRDGAGANLWGQGQGKLRTAPYSTRWTTAPASAWPIARHYSKTTTEFLGSGQLRFEQHRADGAAFMGDATASTANRQTAMVDAVRIAESTGN